MDIMHEEEMDYRAMYLRMVNAVEDAINLLIEAQRECEEMYIGSPSEEPPDMDLTLRRMKEEENLSLEEA